LKELGGLKVAKARVWLWLHTPLDHQLSMTQRNVMADYDHLWYQVEVW